MGLLDTVSKVSNGLQIGGTALSLVGAAKSFLSPSDQPDVDFGLIFSLPKTENGSFSAQITDHYLEDGEFVQDHVIFEPAKFSLTADVAELVYEKSAIEKYVQQVLDRLGILNVLTPAQSQSAKKAFAEYERLKSAALSVAKQFNDIAAFWDSSKFGKNKQQEVFSLIRNMFYSRQVMKVQTPWAVFNSMIIESFEFNQDESTNTMSSVTLNMKEIRVVSTQSGLGKIVNRNGEKKAPVANKGAVQKDESLAVQAGNNAKAAFGKLFGG